MPNKYNFQIRLLLGVYIYILTAVVIRANMATERLLGVTAFPSFSKISSHFCVNLLICPKWRSCSDVSMGGESLSLFQIQIFETQYYVQCKVSLPWQFAYDTVARDTKQSKWVFLNHLVKHKQNPFPRLSDPLYTMSVLLDHTIKQMAWDDFIFVTL